MIRKTLILLFILTLAGCGKKTSVVDFKGHTINVAQLNGKWLVVNYWADWCGNCKKEMAALETLHQHHHDKVVVLGVSFDQLSNDELVMRQRQYQLSFPLASTFPMSQFTVKTIDSLPRTFVFSPQGKLVATLYGPQSEKSLLAQMK